MQDQTSKTLLTTREAAKLLGVHRNTICRLNNRGVLKAYRIGDRGDRRFFQVEVEALRKRKMAAKARRRNKIPQEANLSLVDEAGETANNI